jgi:hypothetical protein
VTPPNETKEASMKNPWMSMWLSAANKAAGAARGFGTAELHRQRKTMAKEAARYRSRAIDLQDADAGEASEKSGFIARSGARASRRRLGGRLPSAVL